MYSNRTVRILRVRTYYNPSAMLPIIPTISIAIIRPKFGRCKLRRFYQGMCVSHRKVTRSNSNFHSSFQLDQFSPIIVCEQCYNIMNSYEENCYIVDAKLCTDFSIVTTMGITCAIFVRLFDFKFGKKSTKCSHYLRSTSSSSRKRNYGYYVGCLMTTISRSGRAGRAKKNTIRRQRDPGRPFSFLSDRPFATRCLLRRRPLPYSRRVRISIWHDVKRRY